MIYKEHLIELWVNGFKLDLESQKSLNLRFQNVLYDPEKISSTQAEYSFEFELPSTPNNDRIFGYANNLSKLNKFHQRWNAEVYADGTIIFEGSLTLNAFKNKKYKCNLVSVKVYSLDEIFGDSMMNEFDWYIPFSGATSINDYNSRLNTEVIFPLVSYGVFQKSPYNSDSAANDYTSKFDLDEYNRWYIESFYPSLSMLETLKRVFEYKGYTVAGDVFEDYFLKDIFMSVNLADGQSPEYNLGNPLFGEVDLNVSMTTSGNGYQQELSFPYFEVTSLENGSYEPQTKYNFSEVGIYDFLSEGTVTMTYPDRPSYMYQPNESIIVIPADGFYKIEMTVSSTLNTSGTINVPQYTVNANSGEMNEEYIDIPVGFSENTPIEIHLVRNYNDNIELIKGKNNKKYAIGNPTIETYTVNGRTYTNATSWLTCFPHEDPYNAVLPTKQNDLSLRNTSSKLGGRRGESTNSTSTSSSSSGSQSGNFGGRRSRTRGGSIDISGGGRRYTPESLGYMYNDDEIMCYDQAVSDTFICGLSSMFGGVASVMKNGYSWSASNSEKNESFYPEIGYSFYSTTSAETVTSEQTDKNTNTYINTPISYINASNNMMNGYISCMVRLNKNDILSLVEVHRGYDTKNYSTTTNIHFKISAFSPKSYEILKAEQENRYEANSQFDYDLRLSNFLNDEKKMSDWVQNVLDAFNLDLIQDGNNVFINTKKKFNRELNYAIDIDNRCNSSDAESSMIDYPKSMAVRYKIDTEEWGFEKSVNPPEKLNDEDWEDYGDSGFTTIQLNDDAYATSSSDKNLQFSYTWYDNFNWYAVNSAFTKTSDEAVTLRLPVISKYSYMIDGYDYEESMKHDGYGLSQRFWFKPNATNSYVWTRTYPVEQIYIYEPTNLWTNYQDMYLNLSYKTTENSLLTQYFNITPYLASNYVTVEVYLSAEEYKSIKNGAMVHFDSDLYLPVEINGYDPTGNNPTELKMIKKI